MNAVSPRCRRVRSLLYAYCDGELTKRDREQVDEHVVKCRDCGTVLSQVELESLRLREALVPMEPPVAFTQAVMDRVRDAVAAEQAQAPPHGFTRRVMERVREEAGAPEPVGFGRRRLAAALVCAALVLLALGLRMTIGTSTPPGPRPDWVVAIADRESGLVPGQTITLPFALDFAQGEVELDARGVDETSRWALALAGPVRGRLLARGHLRLDEGELDLRPAGSAGDSTPSFRLEFASGQSLLLRDGDFEISAQKATADAGELLPPGLGRVVVHVRHGRATYRTASGDQEYGLSAGHVAIAEPLEPLQLFRLPDRASLPPATVRQTNRPEEEHEGAEVVVRGGVFEPNGRAVAGARVRLHLGEGLRETLANASGSYEFRFALPSDRLVVPYLSVAAPEGSDLGPVAYHPFHRRPEPGETTFENLQLAAQQRIQGRVLSSETLRPRNATVRAIRFDSFFRPAWELAATKSDARGRFDLTGWTRDLRGEATVLVVEPSEGPPEAVYGLARAIAGEELVVSLRPSTLVEVRVQDPATRIVWVEHRPPGPLAAYWRRFERHELADGETTLRVRVPVGSPVRWWEDMGTSLPALGRVGFVGSDGGGSGVALLDPELEEVQVPTAVREGPFAGWQITDQARGRWSPPRSKVAGEDPSAPRVAIPVRLVDAKARTPVERALVFARVGDAEPWFAGHSDVHGGLSIARLPVGTTVRIVAIDAGDDRVGELVLDVKQDDPMHTIEMVATATLSGRLSGSEPGEGERIVEFAVVGERMRDYRGVAVIGSDGSFRLRDVPPGRVRVRFRDRSFRFDASSGDQTLPDLARWQKDRQKEN